MARSVASPRHRVIILSIGAYWYCSRPATPSECERRQRWSKSRGRPLTNAELKAAQWVSCVPDCLEMTSKEETQYPQRFSRSTSQAHSKITQVDKKVENNPGIPWTVGRAVVCFYQDESLNNRKNKVTQPPPLFCPSARGGTKSGYTSQPCPCPELPLYPSASVLESQCWSVRMLTMEKTCIAMLTMESIPAIVTYMYLDGCVGGFVCL